MTLEATIDAAWEVRDTISTTTQGTVREAVEAAISALDGGDLRVAEPDGSGIWRVNQWLKKAVLLSFRLNDNAIIQGPGAGTATANWFDKVPSKFAGWGDDVFRAAGFRAVPGAIVRRGSYIGKNVVLMPCFVNIGAHVGDNTMVDTWATVGSCAQIGANVHLSGGVGIGGVLEPLQANPVVIEDDCFIGARSEVVEGVHLERGVVLSMAYSFRRRAKSSTGPPAKFSSVACLLTRWSYPAAWPASHCPTARRGRRCHAR